MNQTPIIVLAAIVLAVIVAIAAVQVSGVKSWRDVPNALRALARRRPRWGSPTLAAARRRPTPTTQYRRWLASRGQAGMLVLALIGLLVLFLLLQNVGALRPGRAAPSGEFVVRIAPFTVEGGDARTGETVAEQLRAELGARAGQPVNLGLLRSPITSPEEAIAAARANGAEVIIWGSALAGTTATAAGLRPQLTWNPDEPWEPRTWQGYDAHLTLPKHFDLAYTTLNGSAVLPPLLDGLALFSRGEADRADERLQAVERDYADVLRPEVPAAVRAIILWAEGLLAESEAEARQALEVAPRAEHWNNLGALLLDQQQNEAARDALLQAVALDPELVAARTNLGRLFMNERRPSDALPDLRTAAQLDGRPVVLSALAEAYRRAGEFGKARDVLTEVIELDPDNGPALCERAILALTDVVTATGRLEWELESPPARSEEQLAELRAQSAQGIGLIEALHTDYLRRANAYGVEDRRAMQRLMETQARRLEEELLNRRYQMVLVMIEQGRLDQQHQRSSLRRFWDLLRGRRTPLQLAVIQADTTLRQAPGGDLQYELQYQRGRAGYLAGDPQLATQAWDAAEALVAAGVPARPEARYGQARLLLDSAQRVEAQTKLTQAIEADERFFPARRLLATLAQEDGRWADAETHLRWLTEHRFSASTAIDLATALRQQDRLAEAEAVLLPLANRDDAPSLTLLGRMYREAGQLDAAANVLDRALATDPRSAAAYEERARVVLASPDPDLATAEQLLRTSVQSDPGRASARIELGKLYANVLGRPGDAAEQFEAAVNLNQADPLAYRELGETLLESGAPEAAVESFRRALQLQPSSHEAHHGLATAYLALGQYDAAVDEEQTALDLAGGNYTLSLVGLGDIARERGRHDEAIEHYSSAIERDPALVGAYLGLGRTAEARGNLDIARGHYERGLEANPDNVLLLLALGNTQLAAGDAQSALATFEQARQIAPGNAATYASLGQALWKSGRSEEALVQLGEAIQRNPSDGQSLLAIAEINASLNKPQEALAAYERAAAVRKNWYEPHFRRGVLLLGMEQTGPAIEALQTAVELNDEFPQGDYWLGRAYRAAGRYADAVRSLRRAITLQPDYYEARLFLGRALDEQGDGAEAIATYTALVAEAPSGDPWRVEAERELERIR